MGNNASSPHREQQRIRERTRENAEQEVHLQSPTRRRHHENVGPPLDDVGAGCARQLSPQSIIRRGSLLPTQLQNETEHNVLQDGEFSGVFGMQRSVTPDQPSSQANPLPTPAESQPTKRQLAQRARRQRELAARLSASQFTTSEPIQPPTLRQHTQRTRRDKERANHAQDRDEQPVSITVNPLPTPMPTQSYPVNQHTRRGTRERTLRPAATSHILEPGNNQNSEMNQPNRRQVGQRLRRERERAARAAATGSAATSNQEASSITSGARLITPAPSQTLGGCARQTATGPSNLTNQLRELPSNPLTPPSTQRVNISYNTPQPASRLRRVVQQTTGLFMVARHPYVEQGSRHDLGHMDIVCQHCQALHWLNESTVKTRNYQHPDFGTCCNSGKVVLPPPRRPPDTLFNLFEADDEQTREFRTNIRAYNMALAFTSLGVAQDDTINRHFGGNSWVFRIQGQLTHLSGALEPQPNTPPSYAQLYLYDPHVALQQRDANSTSSICAHFQTRI
ncbi:hypothetical protein AB1N83_012224 [Pleurotus pulmonarius]